jgi:hypothetical protein
MGVSSETLCGNRYGYRPGEPAEYHVPSRAEPAGTEIGLRTERARHARRLSIKVDAVAADHDKRTVGAAFACHILGIENLRFRDLRREATSQLFEQGFQIQTPSMLSSATPPPAKRTAWCQPLDAPSSESGK